MIMNLCPTFHRDDLWIQIWTHVYEKYSEIIYEIGWTKVPDAHPPRAPGQPTTHWHNNQAYHDQPSLPITFRHKWTKGGCSFLLLSAQFWSNCHGSSVVRPTTRDAGDPAFDSEPCLGRPGKQWSRASDYAIDVPATPTLPDTNLRYQEAFDWWNGQKEDAASSSFFCPPVLIELSHDALGKQWSRDYPIDVPCAPRW